MNELKNDNSSVILVIDHKQKFDTMKYRESQVEYYGKKGMSLLGMMIICWKKGENEAGYEYSFHDYIVKEYISHNHIQVGAIIRLASRIINDNGLDIKTIFFQSDNASGFSSSNVITFIFNLNSCNKKNNVLVISRWIFTETQTGKKKLDAHFSCLNIN